MIRKITKHCPKSTHQVEQRKSQVQLPGTRPTVSAQIKTRIYEVEQTPRLTSEAEAL